MLREEAKWIENKITELQDRNEVLFPMANIGSSDEQQLEFQPWVKDLTNFIKEKGTLLNVDIKNSPGVDLVGDLHDKKFIEILKSKNIGSVLCANILTNITDKEKFANSLLEVIHPGSILIVTVSHQYPYIADPIDTLYRPNPDQLAKLFPNTELVTSALVESDSFARLLWRKKRVFFITCARLFVPFYKFKTWWNLVCYLPHIFKPVSASCVILRRLK